MIYQVTKVTTFPQSVNKIHFENLIYEEQDIHKVFKNIKLETFNTEMWFKFLLFLSQFSE